jgi:DNA-binding MarR family transcriptional regulator
MIDGCLAHARIRHPEGDVDSAENIVAERVSDLARIVRLSRQQWLHDRPGLPIGLVGALAALDRSTGCHAKELAGRAGLDQSTVSRTVAALVGHGLVRREADPQDGRASVLLVTDKGRAALTAARDWYAGLMRQALAGWTPDEVAAFTDGLARFVAAVERVLSEKPCCPERAAR